MSAEPVRKKKESKRKAATDADAEAKALKKKAKKAAAADASQDAAPAPKKRSKAEAPATPPKKSAKKEQDSDDSGVTHVQVAADKQPADLDNFRLSDPVKQLLRSKGIGTLFPIQQATLDHCLDGHDVVGRARTGCGKTLAFVLPIIESLGAAAGGKRGAYGRAPSVVVLAPTRELAKQVCTDFDYLAPAFGLSVLCVYGGAPWGGQENALRRGVDIVVGTPGRVKDFMERGTLKLGQIKWRVLDECDEMLNMGFVEDVEKILTAVDDKDNIQTLLFSATLPAWVRQITKRFLKASHKVVDLIGDDKIKASTSVRHLLLPCHWTQRNTMLTDLLRSYGSSGRTIVFTETKNDANELATALAPVAEARPLHGDIPQSQREVTLDGFRRNRFRVLVATDVAARGLDITGVELVVQAEPPGDAETYIHRSGRTGRAGSSGVSVTLVAKKKEYMIPIIEHKGGFKFERIGAPQPQDIARLAGERAVQAVKDVDHSVVPHFRDAAKQLLEHANNDPELALALTIAHATGHASIKARSLLSSMEDWVTLQYSTKLDVAKPGYVYGYLRRKHIADEDVELIKRVQITADGKGAVFDVPADKAEAFLQACKDASDGTRLFQPKQLPELKAREGEGFGAQQGGWGGRGGGGYGSGGRGYGGGRGGNYGGGRGYGGRGGQQGRGGRGGWQRR